MKGQHKLFDEVMLYDPSEVLDHAPAHGHSVRVSIPDTATMSDEEMYALLPPDTLPIYSTWPVRQWGKSMIGDLYGYYKPRQIGVLEIQGLVNGKEDWVLHGRVYYHGGIHLNNEILTPLRAVVLSTDIERGDPTKGRRVFQLNRLMVSPK